MSTATVWPIIPHIEPSSLQNIWFQPMGFTLQLVSNSPAIIQAAEVSFGGFGPAESTLSPDFIMRFFEHSGKEDTLETPRFWLDGLRMLQCTSRASTLAANLADGHVFGHFSTSTVANLPFFRWHFLELAFFMMLEAKGFMGVHGSALAKNGQAVLLRASSGGGKTTLAYAGARRNFEALAEDVVWLDPRHNCWWGTPWSFHLLPDAKALFPELAPYRPVLQTNGEAKLEVNLEQIRPGSTTVSAQPKAIILLERLPGGSSCLETISPKTGQELWPAGSTGLEMQLPHHANLITQLFQLDTYRLTFGDDIDHALDLLEKILT